MTTPLDRRHFLRASGALGMLGAAAPFAMQLAAAGSAASQSAPDYRALVCIFLFGGNDANNMVVATDQDSYDRYWAARRTGDDPIALMPPGAAPVPIGSTSSVTGRTVTSARMPEAWGGLLPLVPRTVNPVPAGTSASVRTFGIHPLMAPAKNLFDAGRLAVVANVGTLVRPITKAQYQARTVSYPANLFSHNDQQSTWQAGAGEGARVGWGGRMGDILASQNGTSSLFTAISTAGNAVWLSGQSIVQYQLSTGAQPGVVINGATGSSLFGSSVGPAKAREILQGKSTTSLAGLDYSTVTERSMGAAATLNSLFTQSLSAAIPAPPVYTNPISGLTETNSLAVQLQTVAKAIASQRTTGVKRQVFFVSLGGWDTHDFQNSAQSNNLSKVAAAMAYFDGALSAIGGIDMRPNVTTFTASDFSRTFTTNGDGTDHAWGGHQLVMGGSVRGGDIYGQFPTVGVDLGTFRNPDMAGNALVPTTSVDQYAATMGRWLGVSEGNLDLIFPNLRNFASRGMGFL
ncbi:hypothetical protein KOAAANKH_03320 [Brevundimonas sp. NIBR10]|uniref:DUF1501 domain-containing protein n=1 Tax=Brevundimonas sp. NIBR10 TaxID=3015997 RepID=UPI0022F14D3A|nr:DUF1501 domain-containing protein [Brevundimonas sp. NIBR10]WGM48421.1 hypothetical protein KOAAANKH_03320 [Brevundimonas sp. NIBR10]